MALTIGQQLDNVVLDIEKKKLHALTCQARELFAEASKLVGIGRDSSELATLAGKFVTSTISNLSAVFTLLRLDPARKALFLSELERQLTNYQVFKTEPAKVDKVEVHVEVSKSPPPSDTSLPGDTPEHLKKGRKDKKSKK